MIPQHKKFVSHIESRIQENGELYTRFHLGPFVGGQALTVANALRRTLLAEIPGFVITRILIEGVNHEFATLPGIHENILQILLNFKRVTLRYEDPHFNVFSLPTRTFKASLDVIGPRTVTADDIKFPIGFSALVPSQYIATLSSTGILRMQLLIECINPLHVSSKPKATFMGEQENGSVSQELFLENIPKPVKQVNFGIHQVPTFENQEYISLEIWTNGSVTPKRALTYALEKLARIFYEFTTLNHHLS